MSKAKELSEAPAAGSPEDVRVALALVTGGLRASAMMFADCGRKEIGANCLHLARIGEKALGLRVEEASNASARSAPKSVSERGASLKGK